MPYARGPMSSTSPPMVACVGLGANLGDRLATLRAAARDLARTPGVQILARASVYDTAPIGPAQPRFLNSALRVASELDPHALLDRLLEIERAHGRERAHETRFGPRTLDLDFLYAVGVTVATPRLTVPHPRVHERAFALVPMLEIMPEARATLSAALAALPPLGAGAPFPID